MYRRTVRGETRIPSFTSSSEAIRSSPHVRFAAAMSAINWRSSAGSRGRPPGVDFHRQNSRKPVRCHRMSVSGFTTVRTRRQSISRDRATSAMRVASSARRGLTRRSRYNANCLRRKRFSAASWACGRNIDDTNRRTSPATRAIVRTSSREQDSAMPWDVTVAGARPGSLSRGDAARSVFAALVECRDLGPNSFGS